MRRHSDFFSSLKQVEKRLKSEAPPPEPPQQPPPDTNCSTDSMSSPIYLLSNQQNYNSTLHTESEAPTAFLSQSPPFASDSSHQIKNPETKSDFEEDPVEDLVQRLIEQLGFSDCDGLGFVGGCGECGCEGEGGFFSKIVGLRGPKCGKEVERLEGWIGHLMGGGGEKVIEPLRLAHLLVGKACFVGENGGGFGGLEFPSTIEEFLHNDPPTS